MESEKKSQGTEEKAARTRKSPEKSADSEIRDLAVWLLESIEVCDSHAYCLDKTYRRGVRAVMEHEKTERLNKLLGR